MVTLLERIIDMIHYLLERIIDMIHYLLERIVDVIRYLAMNEVTHILNRIGSGDPTGANDLLLLVYEELRALARQRLSQELPGQTLQATALVHEVYLRLLGSEGASHWESRAHFFGAAAEAMRRILIDQARRKNAIKHGGGNMRVELHDDIELPGHAGVTPEELLTLDDALTEFEAIDPVRARVVKLHVYSGFTLTETADALGLSLATVKRHWVFARSWLFGKIRQR